MADLRIFSYLPNPRIWKSTIAARLCGVEVETSVDSITITGTGKPPRGQTKKGAPVETHGDHRIAMAFSIASLGASSEIRINECANVNTSFPGFVELAHQTGIRITVDVG